MTDESRQDDAYEAEVERRVALQLAEKAAEEEAEREATERAELIETVKTLKADKAAIEATVALQGSRLVVVERLLNGVPEVPGESEARAGLVATVNTAVLDNAAQQGTLDLLAAGYSQVATSVEEVQGEQLSGPAARKMLTYAGGAGGGSVVVWEIIKQLSAMLGG